MKTALITGASGYLGSHLAKTLKKSGWKVIGLDIKHTDNLYLDMFHPCDVRNGGELHHLFDKVNIDTVFHLAGRIEVGESVKYPQLFFDNNTNGTNVLLDVMKFFGVKNIVYSSTAGVYKSKYLPLHECDEVEPMNNPYAASKYAAELAIRHSGLNYVIFRYFNLAGADPELEMGECHDPETHLIPRILQNLNSFTIYGKNYDTPDGTCIRDYVHVSDVAEAHLLAADYLSKNPSRIFNLGTGIGYSVQDIVNLIGKLTDEKITYSFGDRRPGDPPFLVADIKYASEVLQYRPKHDIVSIIKTSYEWQRKYDRQRQE
jgi:UDP-glucose 4-epimerase